ncbi:MAG: phosphatase PAP2 family protein [Sediminibacterium sp.]|jgi:membrane-associated phospholipid phosphatase
MMQNLIEGIIKWDQALFFRINGDWTNAFLNKWLLWFRTSDNWIPFYVVFLIYLIQKLKVKTWKWLVIAIVNIALTDQLSSNFFKPFVHRLRPCQDPNILHKVHLLVDHCLTSFSFTSSHAANHFGIATFIFFTLKPLLNNYRYLFLVWAGIISYAQVYVGVHYPIDVFGGAMIGILFGKGASIVYKKWDLNAATRN